MVVMQFSFLIFFMSFHRVVTAVEKTFIDMLTGHIS